MRIIKGFKKFTSKKGTSCCAVSVETEYGQAENGVGIKCEQVMIYGDDCSVITDKSVGHELVGYFGFSGGVVACQCPAVK